MSTAVEVESAVADTRLGLGISFSNHAVALMANEQSDVAALDSSIPVMSKEELLKVAVTNGGYETPSLNDSLYLNFKGYRRIENLDEYTGLKSLWLHSNGFTKIENISHLVELRCLFLQSNAFTRIENLHGLESLVQLDLSDNNICNVEGLSHLLNLTTLNLAKNALEDSASIQHLVECKNLSALDLSRNKLAGKDILDCIAGIETLKSLNMSGNPVCNKVAYFRKKIIVANKSLRYLDRPIFDEERATVEEWARAGPDGEKMLKEKLLAMKHARERNALQEFRQWQESVRRSDVNNDVEVKEITLDSSAAEPRRQEESVATEENIIDIETNADAVVNEEEVKEMISLDSSAAEPRRQEEPVAMEEKINLESNAYAVGIEKEAQMKLVTNADKEDNDESCVDDLENEDNRFVSKDVKNLSAYLNTLGSRRSWCELQAASSKAPAVVLPPDALSFDVVSSDDDEGETNVESFSP